MPLGKDQMVVTRVVWPLEIHGEIAVEQHRDDVGGGHRGGRVTRPGHSARTEVTLRHINSWPQNATRPAAPATARHVSSTAGTPSNHPETLTSIRDLGNIQPVDLTGMRP